jgi:phosphoglycolate phosphatase-like HAD superfamily hydrolase
MIKHIILDIDKILYNLGDLHYKTFCKVVTEILKEKFCPSLPEYNQNYKGLPIIKQFEQIAESKKVIELDTEACKSLFDYYQHQDFLAKLDYNETRMRTLQALRDNLGLSFSVVTNETYDFTREFIKRYIGELFIGFVQCKESNREPKPNQDMYLRSFYIRNIFPNEVLCIENSVESFNTAKMLGCKAMMLEDAEHFSYELIRKVIQF